MEKQEYYSEQEKYIQRKVVEAFGTRFETSSLGKIDLGSFNGITEWLKEPKGIVLVHGYPGTGKTYLASAVFSYLFNKFRSKRIYKESQIFNKIYAGFGTNSDSNSIEYLKRLIDDEFIVVDDLGSMGKSENAWKESMIFEMVDFRYSTQQPTIFTTNLTYNDFLNMYNLRIASRLFAKENLIINSGNIDLRKEGL